VPITGVFTLVDVELTVKTNVHWMTFPIGRKGFAAGDSLGDGACPSAKDAVRKAKLKIQLLRSIVVLVVERKICDYSSRRLLRRLLLTLLRLLREFPQVRFH
jgi:hypothetical protein